MRVRIACMAIVAAGIAAAADKPSVVILATGGTIAGTAASETAASYAVAQLGVDTLIAAVPEIRSLANVSGEQIVNIASQDMSDHVWLMLAARVNTLLAGDVDGVVITHGTDTLEETAYFLQLVVRSDKPVVLTAAMRPSTALSADGPLNLFNAVAVAADPAARNRGVLVVIDDDIHGARTVTKTHTTDVQAFRSPDLGLVGTTLYGQNAFFRRPHVVHTRSSAFSVEGIETLPRVSVIFMHAGAAPALIDAAAADGAQGLVIAGVGNGNMNGASLAAVERAIARGVVVIRATRVGGGAVARNIEVDDDAIGTVVSGTLSPAKARVLLKLVLLKTSDPARVQSYFDHY